MILKRVSLMYNWSWILWKINHPISFGSKSTVKSLLKGSKQLFICNEKHTLHCYHCDIINLCKTLEWLQLAFSLMYCYTLGGIASICFKFHFQTDYKQTLRTHQGCQKIRIFVRNLKILIARSTIHPSLSKIKNHYWKTSKIEKKNH